MKKLVFLFVLAASFFVISCSKDKAEAAGNVQIRIQNTTSTTLSTVTLGTKTYGDILPGAFTTYESFEKIFGMPGITFYNGNKPVNYTLGWCGSPMQPYLEDGKYICTVLPDSTISNGFSYTFSKE